MDALRRFVAILRADVLERSRSLRFWIVIGLTVVAAWWSFPPLSANYLPVAFGEHTRGTYSSAWVGMVIALQVSTLLSLIGFYLVRGTLARDIDTRVWQLLVATPMTRTSYLLAKWTSHMLVFGLIVAVALLVGVVAQFVRAEDTHLHLWELLKPSLVVVLPAMTLTAMFAVWFDLLPWLRRTAGNILYFFVWVFITSVSLAQLVPSDDGPMQDSWASDPAGIAMVSRDFERDPATGALGEKNAGLSIGSAMFEEKVTTFSWTHWTPRVMDLLGRAIWLLISLLGVIAAAPLLDRFAAISGNPATRTKNGSGARLRWLEWLLAPLQRSPTGTLVAAELRLVLRRRPRWWWLAVLILGGMQLFGSEVVVANALIGSWLLSIDVCSRAILRERETGTEAFVFSAAKAGRRLLAARTATLLLLLIVPVLPALLHFSISQPSLALATLVVSASIGAWALALGTLSRSPRPFELLLLIFAYGGVQGAPVLNVVSATASTTLWHAAGLPLALTLLLLFWPRLRPRY